MMEVYVRCCGAGDPIQMYIGEIPGGTGPTLTGEFDIACTGFWITRLSGDKLRRLSCSRVMGNLGDRGF